MAGKLYQFLLLDRQKIQESTEFEEYTSGEMYDKLKKKYKNSLVILEYISNLAKLKLEEYQTEGKVAENKCADTMRKIKGDNGFSDGDIKEFEKYVRKVVNNPKHTYDIPFEPEKIEKLEQYEILKIRLDYEQDKYFKCSSVVAYIRDLKKAFYQSYGFNSLYENREWGNICEKHVELLQRVLEWFYTLETEEVEIADTIPAEISALDKEELDQDKLENDEPDYILPHHVVVFDAIIALTREIVNNVDGAGKIKAHWREQRLDMSYGTDQLSDLIRFDILCEERISKGDLSKSEQSEIRECIVSAVRKISKQSRSNLVLMGEIFPHDEDYAKYKKVCDQLSENIKKYDSNRRGKTEHFNTEEEKIRDKKLKAGQKRAQDEAFKGMEQVLVDMQEGNKNALDKIIKRIDYKTRYVTEDYYSKIDVSLYKSLFDALRRETRLVYKDSEEGEEPKRITMVENRNQIFKYKDKVIVTLTFPNTDIEQFKTAAFVADAQDLRKVYVDSGKCAWTYKHSRKAPEKEYDKKTLKPDKITTKGGSMDLLQTILGDYEQPDDKKVYYVTESHKFDARKKYIKKVDKLVRKPDPRYYQGRIRIEEDNISETVCFNNEINMTDATILYFDDMKKFADFLDNMQ